MIDLARRPDWKSRLTLYLESIRRESFAWGRHDCVVGLAAGAVEAITGTDPAAEFRGAYRTAKQAARTLHKAGFATLGDAVASVLPETVSRLDMRVGDIGLTASDGEIGEALCVFDVSVCWALSETGLVVQPKSAATRFYRVG